MKLNAWPVLTIVGITIAVLLGYLIAGIGRLTDCVLGYDDITQDGFAADGYGNQ